MTARTRKPCPGCARQTRDGLLCLRCVAVARSQLERLAALWPSLVESVTRQTRMGPRSEGRSGSIHGPVPYDPGASEVAARIRATLWRWVRDAVEDHGAPMPADTVPAWCAALVLDLSAIRREPDAHLLTGDLSGCIRDILRAIDYPDDRARVATGRPCPSHTADGEPCGGRLVAVFPAEGTPHIDCPVRQGAVEGCGAVWAPQRWDSLIVAVETREALIAAQIGRGGPAAGNRGSYLAAVEWGPRLDLLTVADAVVLYGVPRSTLYRWISEGHVQRREVGGVEEMLVSASEVSRAIVEHPTRGAILGR